jgi:DNA-binding transcriptional ArsR family regulator
VETRTDTLLHLHQHLLRLVRLKGMRFVILYEWMTELPLKPRVVLTYASLVSLSTARMRTRAVDVGDFVQRTPRSVRRHLGELERAGLIVRRARYEGRRRTANAYDLLWHPAMPTALKGARYVAGVTGRVDPGDTDDPDADDQRGMSPVSTQFRNAAGSEKHASNSPVTSEEDLPEALRDALTKAAPGQVDDCLRVIREACSALDADHRRRVRLIALRRLLDRCERREPANPVGLLRACLVPDALNTVQATTETCRRLRDAIARSDTQLERARNGFALVRAMRKRALDVRTYVAQHVAAFGVEPADLPCACPNDPELAKLLAEVERLQDLVRTARERNDAAAANRAEEGLHRLERSLDQLIQRRRGQVS